VSEAITGATITDDQIRELLAKHCECRPLDVERTSHSHDCDDEIVEDCRVALGGKPNGQLYPRSTSTAIIQRMDARDRCAAMYFSFVTSAIVESV
jgi:5-methylcytosine-specific restriction endonuclease McrA